MCVHTSVHARTQPYTHGHTHPLLPAQAQHGGHRRDNWLLMLMISRVFSPMTWKEGGLRASQSPCLVGAGVQALTPTSTCTPFLSPRGGAILGASPLIPRDSSFLDSLAFLPATKSPVFPRTLPKASVVRAQCPRVGGVGSFWRQPGRPSAVCPLPRARQSRALSCPSPVGEKGGPREPHANPNRKSLARPRRAGSGLSTEVAAGWRCSPANLVSALGWVCSPGVTQVPAVLSQSTLWLRFNSTSIFWATEM